MAKKKAARKKKPKTLPPITEAQAFDLFWNEVLKKNKIESEETVLFKADEFEKAMLYAFRTGWHYSFLAIAHEFGNRAKEMLEPTTKGET